MKKYCFICLTILLVVLSACTSKTDTSSSSAEPNEKQESVSDDNKGKENTDLSEVKAKEVLTTYKNTFMKIADESAKDGKVENYPTKEKLIAYFQTIMSEDLANRLANTYFKEVNENLYIKSMDAPVWLNAKQPFTLKKISNLEYNIIQEQNSELTGHVKNIFTLIFVNNQWKVKDVEKQQLAKEDVGITEEKAIAIVRQSLRISKDSDKKVEIDHVDNKGNYIIHVYESVTTEDDTHTATLGWYMVDKQDGGVKDMISNQDMD